MGARRLCSPYRRGVACAHARRAPRSLTPCAQGLLPSRGRRLPLCIRRRGVRPDRPQVPVGIGRVEEFVAVRRGRGEMRLAVAQRPVVERRKQAQRHPRQPRPRIEISHRAQHFLRRHRERRRCPFRPLERGVRIRLPFVGGRRTRLVVGRCFITPAPRFLVGAGPRFVHFAQRFVRFAQSLVVGVRHGVEGHRRSVDRAQSLVGAGSRFVHFAQSLVGGWPRFVAPALRFVDLRRRSI